MDQSEQPPAGGKFKHSNLGALKLAFVATTLQGYGPGPKLRAFLLPGHESHLEDLSFESSYFGDVPASIGERADQVVIDWLSKAATPEQAAQSMKGLIQDLSETPVTAETKQMTEMCLESLRRIESKVIPDPYARNNAERSIRFLRDEVSNSMESPRTAPHGGGYSK